MTEQAREPLVPAGVELREYSYIPLQFERLFSSDTWVLATDEQRVACLYLWCKSWHQVPAGSIPSDERILAELSRTGSRWKRLRDHCLRGWVLCSDGRYYHPVVAEKVMDAWQGKINASKKGKAGAAKRWQKSGNGAGMPQLDLEDSNRREGKGDEGKGVDTPHAPFALPDWVDAEAWAGFVEMRAKSKHPLNTDRARKGIVADLADLRTKGQDPNRCLDQSTKRGWRGVFAVKEDVPAARRQQGSSLEQHNAEVARRWAAGGKP